MEAYGHLWTLMDVHEKISSEINKPEDLFTVFENSPFVPFSTLSLKLTCPKKFLEPFACFAFTFFDLSY
jgi:hypothetical protein